MYLSNLKGFTILDDRDPDETYDPAPEGLSKGYTPRDMSAYPFNYSAYTEPFPQHLYIDRAEWPERIEYLDKTNGWASQRWDADKIPALDQNGTNYCWAHAAVSCLLCWRAMSGDPYVELSPASVAAPIKNGRNVGGWPTQAVEFIAERGCAPMSSWPANSRSLSHDNPDTNQDRQPYKLEGWYECRSNDLDAIGSALLLGMVGAGGYSHMSHAEMAYRLYVRGRDDFGTQMKNSWGKHRDNEIWFGRKALAFEMVIPMASKVVRNTA